MGWFLFFFFLAVSIGAELLRPKPKFEELRPAGLGDFQFPTATEGRPVPLVWGTVKIKGPNVVWYGGLQKFPVTENVPTGMFSSETVIRFYRYAVGMQFALCRGTADAITRIWINEKAISNGRATSGDITVSNLNLFGGDDTGTGGIAGTGTWYNGDLTSQAVDSFLSAYQSPTPAYRGTCMFVWKTGGLIFNGDPWNPEFWPSGYIGNSPNIYPWAFEIKRIPNGLALSASEALINDDLSSQHRGDANIMNVIYEILTDTDWGLKVPTSEIDTSNFQAAATTLANEGNGFSMLLDNASEASELLSELARQADGALYFDRGAGLWKMKLARDDYTPASLDTFDENEIEELHEYSRQTWEETANQVRLQFIDRTDSWKDTYALAQDMANSEIQAGYVSADVVFPGVKHPQTANDLAWRELRTLSYPLAKVSFSINRSFFDKRPGDVFKLNWTRLGISDVVFRVSKIDYGVIEKGTIKVDAVEDIFAAGSGVYGNPTGSGWGGEADPPDPPVTGDTLVVEAPKQMVDADTLDNTLNPRVWCGARRPSTSTIQFQMYSRIGTTAPLGGTFLTDAKITRFLYKSELDTALSAYGTSATRPATDYSIELTNNSPDDISIFEIAGDETSVSSLFLIAYIDDSVNGGEWVGYEILTDVGGGVVELQNVYRGLFHTPPRDHAAGTVVWLVGQAGGNLTFRTFGAEANDEMDVQLRGVGYEDETTEGSTPIESLHIDRIWRVPLAPRDPVLNSNYAPSSEDLDTDYSTETGLSGDDALGLEAIVTPRNWRNSDVLLDTQLNLIATYLDDSPEFDMVLRLDPTGSPTDVTVNITGSGSSDPTAYFLRNAVIEALGSNTVIPSDARLIVTARHDPTELSGPYTNPEDMEYDFTVTSALQGNDQLVFGALTVSVISDVVNIGTTETLNFDIKTALPSSGILEGRLNGGSFVTIVAASSTTGNIAVSSGDTLELRFTQAPAADQFFDITGTVSDNGYGVLLA